MYKNIFLIPSVCKSMTTVYWKNFPSESFSKKKSNVLCARDRKLFPVYGGLQIRLKVWKSGGPSSNVVGIICPLIGIGLTELPNLRWAKAHPAHPLVASLWNKNTMKDNQLLLLHSFKLLIFDYSTLWSPFFWNCT